MESNKDYFEIDVLSLLRKCLKRWKLIVLCAVAGYAVGVFISRSIPKEYTSSSTVAPERMRSVGSSRISSFAGMAGINLQTGTSDAMSPLIFPNVVKSVPFIEKLFTVPVEFEYKGDTVSTDVYNYFKSYIRKPWWNTLFKRSAEIVPVKTPLSLDYYNLTPEESSVIGQIKSRTGLSMDKDTYLITMTASAQDPGVAETLCRAVSERLQSYCEEYYTSKERKDLKYFESLLEDSRRSYYEAQEKYASYLDSNQGLSHMKNQAEGVRLSDEMKLQYALYTSCAQQVQQAQAQVQKETPVFTLIHPATYPFAPSSTSAMVIKFAFLLVGLLLSMAGVIVFDKK